MREEHEESAAAEEQEESRAAAETIEEASAAAEAKLPAGVKLDDSANQNQQMDSADSGVAIQFVEVAPGGRFWESGILQSIRRVLVMMTLITLPITPLSVVFYLGADYFSACTGLMVSENCVLIEFVMQRQFRGSLWRILTIRSMSGVSLAVWLSIYRLRW